MTSAATCARGFSTVSACALLKPNSRSCHPRFQRHQQITVLNRANRPTSHHHPRRFRFALLGGFALILESELFLGSFSLRSAGFAATETDVSSAIALASFAQSRMDARCSAESATNSSPQRSLSWYRTNARVRSGSASGGKCNSTPTDSPVTSSPAMIAATPRSHTFTDLPGIVSGTPERSTVRSTCACTRKRGTRRLDGPLQPSVCAPAAISFWCPVEERRFSAALDRLNNTGFSHRGLSSQLHNLAPARKQRHACHPDEQSVFHHARHLA